MAKRIWELFGKRRRITKLGIILWLEKCPIYIYYKLEDYKPMIY